MLPPLHRWVLLFKCSTHIITHIFSLTTLREHLVFRVLLKLRAPSFLKRKPSSHVLHAQPIKLNIQVFLEKFLSKYIRNINAKNGAGR